MPDAVLRVAKPNAPSVAAMLTMKIGAIRVGLLEAEHLLVHRGERDDDRDARLVASAGEQPTWSR